MLVIVASPLGLVLAVAAVVVADAVVAPVVPRLEMIAVVVADLDAVVAPVVPRLKVVAVVLAGVALAGAREAARRPLPPVVAAAAGQAVELPVALGDLRVAR